MEIDFGLKEIMLISIWKILDKINQKKEHFKHKELNLNNHVNIVYKEMVVMLKCKFMPLKLKNQLKQMEKIKDLMLLLLLDLNLLINKLKISLVFLI